MRLCVTLGALFAIALLCASGVADQVWTGRPVSRQSLEGFVQVNGVRLQYLDWGGRGPALILIHGLADNPHVFDDLAPAFTDRFHIIAYARRGSGSSDAQGPYDVSTLTEDLHRLMDALGIAKADLVGVSAGGDEITEMAGRYPERVDRIVYLDAAYDWADPDFKSAYEALPTYVFDRTADAMASLAAFRSFEKMTSYRELDDMSRIESNLRAKLVIRSDGSLEDRIPKSLTAALFTALMDNKLLDYSRVRCPALAVYAEHSLLDVHASDPRQREDAIAFEQKYWDPFQEKSISKLRRELPHVTIVRIPDSRHGSFFLTHRQEVVTAMRKFLITQ
jgi:pimeloyl-ACP methyl ester carboxylesterase